MSIHWHGSADCYVAVSIADILAGKLEAWTQTTNEDGTITVTFDLNSMGYFANGAELKGLTIATVTANNVTGTVTYKTISLESNAGEHDCKVDGHAWHAATCTTPKTCAVCGSTEGDSLGHNIICRWTVPNTSNHSQKNPAPCRKELDFVDY